MSHCGPVSDLSTPPIITSSSSLTMTVPSLRALMATARPTVTTNLEMCLEMPDLLMTTATTVTTTTTGAPATERRTPPAAQVISSNVETSRHHSQDARPSIASPTRSCLRRSARLAQNATESSANPPVITNEYSPGSEATVRTSSVSTNAAVDATTTSYVTTTTHDAPSSTSSTWVPSTPLPVPMTISSAPANQPPRGVSRRPKRAATTTSTATTPSKRTRTTSSPSSKTSRRSKRVKPSSNLKQPPIASTGSTEGGSTQPGGDPMAMSDPTGEGLTDQDKKPSAVASDVVTCTICMCEPAFSEVSSIDGCDHRYCFSCIGQWAERENTCPLCKKRFTRIARLHPQRKKRGATAPVKNTKHVFKRDQRADLIPGAALEGLLASIANGTALGNGGRLGLGRYLFASHLGTPGSNIRRVRTARIAVGSSMGTAARFDAAAAAAFLPPPFFNFENDEELDDDPAMAMGGSFMGILPAFMNSMLRSHHQGLSMTGFGTNNNAPSHSTTTAGMPLPFHHHHVMSSNLRTHARNAHDSLAGQSAENALEIGDDSDDDGGDEVEVVQVTHAML